MNPHGGFFLLPTSRAFRGGLLRRPSAAARTGSLPRLTNMSVSRGLAIAREILCTRVTALIGKSSTLRCVRIIPRLIPIEGILSPAGMSPPRHSSKRRKCSLWAIVDRLEADGSPARLDNNLTSFSCKAMAHNHLGRAIAPSPSGTAKPRKGVLPAPRPPFPPPTMFSDVYYEPYEPILD